MARTIGLVNPAKANPEAPKKEPVKTKPEK